MGLDSDPDLDSMNLDPTLQKKAHLSFFACEFIFPLRKKVLITVLGIVDFKK
jgi:hypothetical protein